MAEHHDRRPAPARHALLALGALGLVLAVLLAGTLGPAAASDAFPDVPDSSAFHDDIGWAVETGLTSGYVDGTFRPTAPVSRQAAAAFLYRWWLALGRTDPDPLPDPGFPDVPPTHQFHDDIAWAAAVGLTTGYDDGTFRPTAPVTRQAMAAYLHRLSLVLELPDPDPLPDPGFGDVAPGHPFYDDIAWAAAVGITNGFDDGDFHSTAPVSRQAAAAFLHRLWDHVPLLVVDDGGDATDAVPGDGTCDDGTGACTLRAAVQEANATPGQARIAFDDGIDLVELTIEARSDGALTPTYGDDDLAANGDLDITDHLTIDGTGVTVDAGALGVRVEPCNVFQRCAIAHTDGTFDVPPGNDVPSVALRGLRLAGGYSGGELRVRNGHVLVEDVTVEQNRGDAIFQREGTLHVRRSSVVGNVGSVVVADGELLVEQSTIGAAAGEGITVWCFRFSCSVGTVPAETELWADRGNVTVSASTIDDLRVTNLAQAAVAGSLVDACEGTIASAGHNLTRPGCFAVPGPGDRTDTSGILVAEPADNGGPTPTRLLLANSQGIDAIPIGTRGLCDGTFRTDQRGAPRPEGGACDIGAVEGASADPGALALVVDSGADTVDAVPGDSRCADTAGDCTLRAAIGEANAAPLRDHIAFAPEVSAVALTRPGTGADGGDLDVTAPVTIDGPGVTVTQTTADRVLDAATDLEVTGLTLAGGDLPGADGGGLHHDGGGDLVLREVTLDGNVGDHGGGLHIAGGSATLERIRATGNVADVGGGIHVAGGDVAVVDATVDANVAARGGGMAVADGTVEVTGTSLSGNRAGDGGSALGGGGIVVDDGTATVRNTTLIDNRLLGTCTAARGAGVQVGSDGTADIAFTTFVANGSTDEGACSSPTLGVDAPGTGTVDVAASLLRSAAGPDGWACSGTPPTSAGWNVVDDPSCALAGTGDVTGGAPLLAEPTDLGDGRLVALPYRNDAGQDLIPAGAPGLCDSTVPTDQRGEPRDPTTACDAGAIEGSTSTDGGGLDLVVDDASDAVDLAPGDGECRTAGGTCTLRAAVLEANAWSAPDTITIADGIDPVLSIPGAGEDVAATGDLDVTDALVIDGGGATVDASGIDRALHGHVELAVSDLTITGGSAPTGGGLLQVGGPLTLTASTLTGNSAELGGGAAATGTATLTVEGSLIETNTATNKGGGVYAARVATITGSTIVGNTATSPTTASGGGLFLDGGTTIADSTIADNVASSPGAASGGGLLIDGGGSITDSTIADNTASSSAAAAVGGGLRLDEGVAYLDRSTLSGNVATSTVARPAGGGAAIDGDGRLWIRVSTVSGNRAMGTYFSGGGGVAVLRGTAIVRRSTFHGGSAARGRAIFVASAGTASVEATAIESGGDRSCGSDAAPVGPLALAGDHNVVSDTTCGLTGTGNQEGVDPLLGPLAENGGPTRTHLPGTGSPVIDAIPYGAAGLCTIDTPTDQRGLPRPSGPTCDVGAVEVQAP